MHEAVKQFIRNLRNKYPEVFENKKVLEFGSLNINGSVREFFKDCDYTGVDMTPGKDVDYVCRAHEFNSRDERYDVVISCEMLEHDSKHDMSIMTMQRVLKPGGMLIITCANHKRKPHNLDCGDGFYVRIRTHLILESIIMFEFEKFYIEDVGEDIYVWGLKK